jgi:hypothetical protein
VLARGIPGGGSSPAGNRSGPGPRQTHQDPPAPPEAGVTEQELT